LVNKVQNLSDQEKFWATNFGNEYIDRNNSNSLLFAKIELWKKILSATTGVETATEFGCNIGLNLLALKEINSKIKLTGYEINSDAVKVAKSIVDADIIQSSFTTHLPPEPVDVSFTCGVLIHIHPKDLSIAYQNLFNFTKKYIVVAEYYNPTPVAVEYRGHSDKLFKRDFAGDLIREFNLKLVDYGFVYRGDNYAPLDDVTWFLLEK